MDDTVRRLVERLDKFVGRSNDFLADHGVNLGLVNLGVNYVAQFLILFLELDDRLLELSGNALFAEPTALGVFTVAFPTLDGLTLVRVHRTIGNRGNAPLSRARSGRRRRGDLGHNSRFRGGGWNRRDSDSALRLEGSDLKSGDIIYTDFVVRQDGRRRRYRDKMVLLCVSIRRRHH